MWLSLRQIKQTDREKERKQTVLDVPSHSANPSTPSHERTHVPTAKDQTGPEDCEVDEGCEPQEAGDRVQAEDGPFVEEAAVAGAVLVGDLEGWVEEEVGQGEEGEGADEKEPERGIGRSFRFGVREVPVRHCNKFREG